MMIRFFIGILGLVLFLMSLSSEASGQRIYIGPGGLSVGAGNVQVDLFRDDHHVYGPSHYHQSDWHDSWYGDDHWRRWGSVYDGRLPDGPPPQPIQEIPPLPTSDELAFMNWTHLRRVLRFAATHLDGQLDALQPGARWRKHLAVGTIRDQVAEDVNRPPDRKARERLQEIVKAYDATARKPEYGAINGLWGFRAVHATLAEFVSPPWDRERRQLAASARELDRQLDEIGAGQRWHEHLALPDDVFAPAPIPDPINTPNQANVSVAPDPRKLRDVLTRFDAVGRNAKYRSIAGLPSFQSTHEILANYVSHFVKVPPPPPLP